MNSGRGYWHLKPKPPLTTAEVSDDSDEVRLAGCGKSKFSPLRIKQNRVELFRRF